MKINRSDFIKLFKLSDNIIVSDETLNDFTEYIIGSYKLFHFIYNEISKLEFDITYNEIIYSFKPVKVEWNNTNADFKNWISGYGSGFNIDLYIKNIIITNSELSTYAHMNNLHNSDDWIKAVTLTDKNKDIITIFRKAYNFFIDNNVYDIINKFNRSYGVKVNFSYNPIEYIHGIGAMNRLNIKGIKFRNELSFLDNGNRNILTDYYIQSALKFGDWWQLDKSIEDIINNID